MPFTVTITNLASGGQLGCSNSIKVDYTQPPDVGTSWVVLTIPGAMVMITPNGFQVSNTAGSLTFQVVFPPATSVSGKTVSATITNGGTPQASDAKTNISAVCPAPTPGSSSDSD